MSRIRTIKPEFFTSADILALTPLSRLFYVSLWCEADRNGRLKWDIETLGYRYFPKNTSEIKGLAEEVINAGLVVIYEIDGKAYAEIPSFLLHQVINNRESLSVIPPRVKVACTRVQGEGKEGREGKGKEPASLTDGFDKFYEAYPKKKSRGDAEKAWKTINPDEHLAENILQAVQRAKTSDQWVRDQGQFIPYPATWLRDKGWLDEITPQLSIIGGSNDPRWKGAK